ncbi:MAG: hypothetical protein JO311_01655 [Candidatus Eremiobacteraeota bacterium]|nr:hypothetical protein [Candidatus Eremiobacteraeota bacterium]MBV9262863.1 hypothetical protein [Candidatus Eremiobacteraeota bacterium]
MRTTMHPMLALFLRLTAVVAVAIVVLVVAGFLLKIAIIAAVIAAVVIGGYFLYTWIWRKPRLPIIR